MNIPFISEWSPVAKLTGAATVIGALVTITAGFDAVAEYQPFATKNMLIAQNEMFTDTIATLRLDGLVDRIDGLQFQLEQKRFQRIQLNDLIEADPSDQYKRDAFERLDASIKQDEERLKELRCKYERRGQDDGKC